MADRFAIADLPKALEARAFPTITTWNRVEGRPRTVDFARALRCEVRDALWMLTRQWQTGELKGEDAGSPAAMRASISTSRLTRFRPGDAAAADFDEVVPLEAQVERRPVQFTIGADPVALDLRLLFGRRWLKLIAGVGDYDELFIAKYAIELPDATERDTAAISAHAEVMQAFAAAAGRAMDGVDLYRYLKGGTGRHAYDGVAVLGIHRGAIDDAAGRFIAWVESVYSRPQTSGDNPAWNPARLEYRFACSSPDPDPARAGMEKTYVADEYYQGVLDWYAFDVVPGNGMPLGPSEAPGAPDPRGSITRTMLPVPLTFPGMPHQRWWTIEDSQTNFGAIRPDTTDLAKLMLIEFGLVYSNDWFIIPFSLRAGGIASMEALVVTDVFGDRYWIDPAGAGEDADWQRWSFLTVSAAERAPAPRAFDRARRDRTARTASDTALLFLPTVPKVQEGPPDEDVRLIRDEMANMVWAIEKVIPAPDGWPRSGDNAAQETRLYHERLIAALGGTTSPPLLANEAKVRYDLMSQVPENWIPFIAVRANGSNRAIELQRASNLRQIDGDTLAPAKIKPRTSLMRAGLDQPAPAAYLVPEEEVPRAGVVVTRSWRRTRGPDGRVHTWIGVRKRVGRGEGSSGLSFDRLVEKPQEI